MHSSVCPLISGTLEYSVYELAGITDLVKLPAPFKNKTEKDTRDEPLLGVILVHVHTFIQFNVVVFFSLSELSFHGNTENILFVHNFEAGDMNRCINSLSLRDYNWDLIYGITWQDEVRQDLSYLLADCRRCMSKSLKVAI